MSIFWKPHRSFLNPACQLTVTFLLPLVVIPVTMIILLYRFVVWVIIRSFRKDLQHFITGSSATCVNSIPNKSISNMLAGLVVQGEISPERISQLFQERILNFKDSEGNLVYHRLQQTVAQFMGYAFWRNEKNFLLTKQVREYDHKGDLYFSKKPGEHDLQRIWLRLAEAPWKNNQIPWEFLTVPNYSQKGKTETHTLIIIRMDHVYCDMYSLVGIVRNLFQTPFAMPKPSRNGVSSSSWKHLKLILSLPYAICKMVMTISTGSQLIEGRGSGKMQYSCTSTVSVDVFKRIRRTHDVSFSTVIVSAANGAIARALRNSDMEVPENLDTDYTLPMPNHPGGLHFCATQVNLQTPCNVKHPEDRLCRTQEILRKVERSPSPLVNYHVLNFLTFAPLPILRTILQVQYNSGHRYLLSSMPATISKEYADGLEIVDVFVTASFSREIGLYVASWGINNKLRFNFNIDELIFGNKISGSKFAKYFEEELKALDSFSLPTNCNHVENSSCILKPFEVQDGVKHLQS